MMNDKARASARAKTSRRQQRGERDGDLFAAAGWDLLSMGSASGLLVGGSLGWAAWVGYIEPVRSSLALLATAAVVVVVLGADALRQGGERGFATAARRTFGGTALWVTVFGTMAVGFTAAALPWLGPQGPWFGPSELEAVVVGVVGFILGCILGAPLVLALNDVLAQGREDRHPEEDPPTSQQSTGMKARAGEFVADSDDPYRNDTLGRQEQVEQFCERVQATATPVVWAVEGGWGTGKTAFSRMCAAAMRSKPGVAEVISVNALTQGVTGAPLVDLAVAVGRALELAAREQTQELDRRRRRSRLAELGEAMSAPTLLLREFGRGDTPAADAVEEMARLVREYVDSLPGLVVVWIDELDRCPPEYALGMLRAVRSICDHPGLVTVLTIHPGALEQAVVQMHGEFDGAERYLGRFIDMRVPLAPPGAAGFEQSQNRGRFVRALYADTPLSQIVATAPLAWEALESLAGHDSLSLRDLEQIVHHAGIVCAGFPPPPAVPDEGSLGTGAYGRSFDPVRRAQDAWSDTVSTAVALGILRFTAPARYRDGSARAWTTQESAVKFFAHALAEVGDFSGHRPAWPADELAQAIARVATRCAADGVAFKVIVELVGLSGAISPLNDDSAGEA